MNIYSGGFWILGILAVVLLIGALKIRAELIINFVLRGVLGMLTIYFINFLLAGRVPGMEIGYNPVTFITSGILGFPGVFMLYGINLYMIIS